jgi:5-hydroxyisourate hydrolase
MTGITTHVLDVAGGRPVAGLTVQLARRTEPDGWELLAEAATDEDGRIRDWAGAPEPAPGQYRLTFATGQHLGADAFYPEVAVVFRVADGRHHHVPLLLSPFGYTTYRGS